jgi:hypothetical protein
MRKPTAWDRLPADVQSVLFIFFVPVLMAFAAVLDGCRALLHRHTKTQGKPFGMLPEGRAPVQTIGLSTNAEPPPNPDP